MKDTKKLKKWAGMLAALQQFEVLLQEAWDAVHQKNLIIKGLQAKKPAPDEATTNIYGLGRNCGKAYRLYENLVASACTMAGETFTVYDIDIPNLKVGAVRDIKRLLEEDEYRPHVIGYDLTNMEFRFRNGSRITFKVAEPYQFSSCPGVSFKQPRANPPAPPAEGAKRESEEPLNKISQRLRCDGIRLVTSSESDYKALRAKGVVIELQQPDYIDQVKEILELRKQIQWMIAKPVAIHYGPGTPRTGGPENIHVPGLFGPKITIEPAKPWTLREWGAFTCGILATVTAGLITMFFMYGRP